jgi:protein-tyrosine phosphatase
MVEPYAIATLSLPRGGRLGVSRLPGAGGDLAADAATISAWRADLVVSMTETAEMEHLGAGDLPVSLRSSGIAWAHLPIRDFGAPDGASRSAWPGLSHRIHAVLDRGGSVLLHCRGGLGRSGMLALRLMVERGEDGRSAVERLRAARPGAVETDAQMAWALEGVPQTHA